MMVHEYNDPGCRRRSEINLAGFLPRSAANGPGIRAVLWVQGCPIRCKGCFNRASWSFSPNHLVSAGHLADRILATGGIDGITLSGGEPFAQAGPLAEVAERVRDAGLTVVTYSGYAWERLTGSNNPSWDRLLAATDLLIAGAFCEENACASRFIGSSNQILFFLSGRIGREQVPVQQHSGETVEFTISPDGTITTTGFPEAVMIRQLTIRCRGA